MKHQQLATLVKDAYSSSKEPFARWMWENHLQCVAKHAETFAKRYGANEDIAVAAAWLHDFGDAFVNRHAKNFENITRREAETVLKKAGFTEEEIDLIMDICIRTHRCRGNDLPETQEAKIVATADAYAHLTTDFYLQFAWMHIPEHKSYDEFIEWVQEKLDRDFNKKIFFEDVKEKVRKRYESLVETFRKTVNH